MGTDVIWWVLLTVLAVYGIATLIASLKWVPLNKIGIVTGPGGNRRVIGKGLHVIIPFGFSVKLVPKGPVRMDGEIRNAITRDGWRLVAHIQLNAKLSQETDSFETGDDDWRKATLDAALRVLRTELENNDASDLRPRPQALDEGVREEINSLTARWGVEIDWTRVTVRWALSVPPAHETHGP
jgi:regulator of protease activity HflC (stomatin/prohibitin superfamily)